MKSVFVFPGQASQYVGMGRELSEAFPLAAAVFDEAFSVLGEDFKRIVWEGPVEELNLTENTQPGVLAASIAAWRVLKERVPAMEPAFLAGHSLGEYSALVAAGSISLADALKTVRERGRLMQKAVPVGVGAMAALMGMEFDDVKAVCEDTRGGRVCIPANDNAPGQVVIAGHADAVERAVEKAKAVGCRRAVMLPVSAPFHCSLMEPARRGLEPVLEKVEFADLRWPVVANVDARPVITGAEARARLEAQVDSPVRWRETMLYLKEQGIEAVVEVGPGSVLRGLAKRVSREWKLINVENVETLEKAVTELCG